MPPRDPFANFARMRREMDQLFGDAWRSAGYLPHRDSGFSPRVDVYYCGDPKKAIVKADVPGLSLEDINIEVTGRELCISGVRMGQESEGRVYQQIEIDSGPFRRVVELQADVDAEAATATYEDGILRIELPLRRQAPESRRVPIERD